ncbi:MAG: Holliday junction branch migration protein RuvA [Armatimonadetes bacterium]|nr:Holliday junction branch migration protein RuvA [Armatimonadota bacterium]
MIAHLNGRLTNLSEDSVVVECAGVGYRVTVAPPTLARLPEVGGTLRLPTWLAVREDALTLYGFSTDEERELFEVLLAVNGVGPKVAQNLVAALPPARLVEAIARGDEASLTQVSGVGKKLAQRLVVELSDKIGTKSWSVAAAPVDARQADVIEALTGLGFTGVESRRLAQFAAKQAGADAPLEELIRLALKQAGSGG